jgi:hypothetical protein
MKIKHNHINIKHIKHWFLSHGYEHMLLNIGTFRVKYSLPSQLNSPKHTHTHTHTHNHNNKIMFATNRWTW